LQGRMLVALKGHVEDGLYDLAAWYLLNGPWSGKAPHSICTFVLI